MASKASPLVQARSPAQAAGESSVREAPAGPLAQYVNDSPRGTAQRRAVQEIQESPYMAAQRKSVASSFSGNGAIVQRVITTDVGALDWEQVDDIPAEGFAGLPGTASRTVSALLPTTAPADPPGMAQWRALGYLRDPAKANGQTLTRMHAIRGRFGGPSAGNNMFLGTAASNNFNANSHYHQVESPLQDYLTDLDGDARRAFHYSVTPNTDDIPIYMQNRIEDEVDPVHQDDVTAFANTHMPNGFLCQADLYREDDDGDIWAANTGENVSTTVDVDEGIEDDD